MANGPLPLFFTVITVGYSISSNTGNIGAETVNCLRSNIMLPSLC